MAALVSTGFAENLWPSARKSFPWDGGCLARPFECARPAQARLACHHCGTIAARIREKEGYFPGEVWSAQGRSHPFPATARCGATSPPGECGPALPVQRLRDKWETVRRSNPDVPRERLPDSRSLRSRPAQPAGQHRACTTRGFRQKAGHCVPWPPPSGRRPGVLSDPEPRQPHAGLGRPTARAWCLACSGGGRWRPQLHC